MSAGESGPSEDLERQLACVAEHEGTLRAWVSRPPDDALRAAVGAAPDGPLGGWTVGVKDVIDTAELPTERGSPVHAGRRPGADASCVALLRAAGAVVAGKTTTSELALFTPTATTNPHDAARTPGGSSSGSAAAVAAGMARVALGTQTVGSVIRPAAFCGVVGVKPTHGLVPLAGVAALAPSFDTLGWMATSVADAAAVLTALTGADAVAVDRPLRLGWYRSHQWPAAQPELAGVLGGAVAALGDVGVEIVELDPLDHLDGVFEAADVVFRYETARCLAWERQHPDGLDRRIAKLLAQADDVSLAACSAAGRHLADARYRHDRFLAEAPFDALLTPSAPGEAPGLATTGDSVFNRVWTSLGVPAVQLPAGQGPSGLPVGFQLTGRVGADPELMAVAAVVERLLVAGR
ncbi:MAG: amidase [Acidimicrobiales bacterium]